MTGTSFIPVMIALIVVIKMKKIIRRFFETGAVTPQASKSLEELNLRRSGIFNRLLNRKVIREFGTDRYYLDQENYLEFNNRRRMMMVIVLCILLVLILADISITNR